MRITGGIARGRSIAVPKAGVRPTQDRVRAALFNILAPHVPGRRFLDLCAGSGAVGLEAWSRGAAFLCWVEADRRVRSVLQRNVESICDSRAEIVAADAVTFLKKKLVEQGFHIIFCDPPYEKLEKRGILRDILDAIRAGGLLLPGGLFVMEQDAAQAVGHSEGWRLVNDRVYGQTRLLFFRTSESSSGAESGPGVSRATQNV
jgi:16S rRNA (guanine966-N2)-methyltransferase